MSWDLSYAAQIIDSQTTAIKKLIALKEESDKTILRQQSEIYRLKAILKLLGRGEEEDAK